MAIITGVKYYNNNGVIMIMEMIIMTGVIIIMSKIIMSAIMTIMWKVKIMAYNKRRKSNV